jgi:multisubunit Na+/H+ antiporter MnhB subunit
MKKTAFRFGMYGVYAIFGIFFLEWLIFRNNSENYDVREIVGWAGILLSTSFVYFALKYYRDKQNNGELSFGEGLKLGVLLILLPAMAFGIFNVLYILFLDPNFLDTYYNYQLEQIKKSVPLAELDSKMKAVQQEKEMFESPFVQFIVMFLSVFVVGLIVTIISTLILRRRVTQPALQ